MAARRDGFGDGRAGRSCFVIAIYFTEFATQIESKYTHESMIHVRTKEEA